MTGEELGNRHAFPSDDSYGMSIRTWLVGMGFQGILASGLRRGTAQIMAELNPLVDAILEDLAKPVPAKKEIPTPKIDRAQ